MDIASVRELRNNLAHYLRLVEQGATIVITNHGRPVAELRPTAITEVRQVAISAA